jgi:hypothetical protein
MSDQVYQLQAQRHSSQDTENTQGLKAASIPLRPGFDISHEENNNL